jgi:hypothetical protein
MQLCCEAERKSEFVKHACSRRCPLSWLRFVTRAQHCGSPRLPGSEFCGHHSMSRPSATASGGALVRVPCPLDPKHTVLEADLKRHLLICTKTREDLKNLQLPCVVLGINLGAASIADEASIAALFAEGAPCLAVALVSDVCVPIVLLNGISSS